MKKEHYDFIIAWDNGAKIEIKPEPKPDVVLYANSGTAVNDFASLTSARNYDDLSVNFQLKPNIKLTYDGETRELKAVEVIWMMKI